MDDTCSILNWRRIDHKITLSGQPTERELSQLKGLGISAVINLAPHTNQGALDDEASVVASLGMEYINIPVDFDNPTEDDFKTFCDEIEKLDDQMIHVHCIYNARVSAFYYRYAKEGRGGSEDEAFKLMDSIWRPGGIWAKYVGIKDSIEQPHRYAGYDY